MEAWISQQCSLCNIVVVLILDCDVFLHCVMVHTLVCVLHVFTCPLGYFVSDHHARQCCSALLMLFFGLHVLHVQLHSTIPCGAVETHTNTPCVWTFYSEFLTLNFKVLQNFELFGLMLRYIRSVQSVCSIGS